ncbi:NUDIX domain-containing protein [Pararhodonellum marinum]|uniref:NUDIX domain-containing protein n=1 Tax=Pararhodonellum marinum TaxID=2755358 RepID=UPI0018906BD0|nr:NUDIX hydrolase [Pararhodonellum marinum]
MPDLEKEIKEKFGERLRLRVNGVLIENNALLMVKHNMGRGRYFWNVPGGGMQYGSDAITNLKREFMEETGLHIQVENYLFAHELLNPPLHALELFFEVRRTAGELTLGKDPELSNDHQLMEEIKYMELDELKSIPNTEKHQMFWGIKSIKDVRIWKGYFNFENKCIK